MEKPFDRIKRLGLCGKCKTRKAADGARTCDDCRVKARNQMRERRKRFRIEGSRCLRCGTKTSPNVWKCANCARNVSKLPPAEDCCYLCGESLSGRRTAVDHVIPVSKGGSCDVSNLRWTHHECNILKSCLYLHDFVDICKKVAKHHCG